MPVGDRVPVKEQAARRRESNRAWHWKHRARGLCRRCGKPHDGDTWDCRTCRVAAAERPGLQPASEAKEPV